MKYEVTCIHVTLSSNYSFFTFSREKLCDKYTLHTIEPPYHEGKPYKSTLNAEERTEQSCNCATAHYASVITTCQIPKM